MKTATPKKTIVRLVPTKINQHQSRYDIRVGKRGTGKVLQSFVAYHDSVESCDNLDDLIEYWRQNNPEYAFVYE